MFVPLAYTPAAMPAGHSILLQSSAEGLSLQGAVETALRASLRARAGRQGLAAAQASVREAGALAGPEILVTPTVLGRAGSDSEVLVTQPLELNGIRRVRTETARARADAETATFLASMRTFELNVRLAYWDLAQAQDALSVARELQSSAEALLGAARRQVEVGAAPGVHAARAELELARARSDVSLAEAEVARRAAALNTLLGRDARSPVSAADRLDDLSPGEARRTQGMASSERPDVALARHSARAAKAEARAAALSSAPDLAIQARVEQFRGDRGVALAVRLPLIDWGARRASRDSAERRREAAELAAEHARRTTEAEAAAAVLDEDRLEAAAREFREEVLARTNALEALAVKGYERGATSYLEVLEARRSSREARLGYAGLLADLARARAKRAWAEGELLIDHTPGEVIR